MKAVDSEVHGCILSGLPSVGQHSTEVHCCPWGALGGALLGAPLVGTDGKTFNVVGVLLSLLEICGIWNPLLAPIQN